MEGTFETTCTCVMYTHKEHNYKFRLFENLMFKLFQSENFLKMTTVENCMGCLVHCVEIMHYLTVCVCLSVSRYMRLEILLIPKEKELSWETPKKEATPASEPRRAVSFLTDLCC